jgi:hypothetical protein
MCGLFYDLATIFFLHAPDQGVESAGTSIGSYVTGAVEQSGQNLYVLCRMFFGINNNTIS